MNDACPFQASLDRVGEMRFIDGFFRHCYSDRGPLLDFVSGTLWVGMVG